MSDIVAQPLDFKLIETLAGEPLPYPWRGTITGSIIARGGPLNQFMSIRQTSSFAMPMCRAQ
jgi:hypothetical protein